MARLDPTSGLAVAGAVLRGAGDGPGIALGRKAAAATEPDVEPPSRFPGKRGGNGHTTAGLDYAMSALADKMHPVG